MRISNRQGVNAMLSLLSTSSSQCLACGKRGQASVLSPAICLNCEALIPWIRIPRCQKCGRHVGCPDCTRGREPSPIMCNRSAVAYNSVMREWLGQYKYRGDERYVPLLGLMLERAYLILKEEKDKEEVKHKFRRASYFRKAVSCISVFPFRPSTSALSWKADLLVPVPVSDSRLVERGFNQAERLAVELSRRTGIPLLPLLIRTHHTGKQSFKGRAERLSDMKHAFAPNSSLQEEYFQWLSRITDSLPTRPIRIIIVDDIYTTGSTIRACAESVRHMTENCSFSSEIYSLTWARS